MDDEIARCNSPRPMKTLIVVSDLADWTALGISTPPGVEVMAARDYLMDSGLHAAPRTRVVNVCRSLRYQRFGYYVSLLAEARGHRVVPTVAGIQDAKSTGMLEYVESELRSEIDRSLASVAGEEFEMDVYFGKSPEAEAAALASALFRVFRCPLLRFRFAKKVRQGNQREAEPAWHLEGAQPLALGSVAEEDREFFARALGDFVVGTLPPIRPLNPAARFDLAILRDPSDPEPASDDRAIRRFIRAGAKIGFDVEVIGRDAIEQVPHYDALFIRDTTTVNHYTYRFARKAKAEGLVVVDDPELILKCLNKVYFAELMTRHRVPIPKTLILDRTNLETLIEEVPFPCVLKQPDSAFSAGVKKASNPDEFRALAQDLLARSSLVVVQEFRPTDFDWRVGVLDGRALYVCRYFMARRHWQIIERDKTSGKKWEGRWETLAVENAPTHVVDAAVRAATLYGDSLFGVDVKEDDKGLAVIEVNENPSLDAGVEDLVLKDELYLQVMRYMMSRVEQRALAAATS